MDPTQKGGLSDALDYAKETAVSKTSASFGDTVVRGMLCNWLVRHPEPSITFQCLACICIEESALNSSSQLLTVMYNHSR